MAIAIVDLASITLNKHYISSRECAGMKKVVKYILPILVVTSVLLFCVSATASIASDPRIIGRSLSEPINLLLLGFGLFNMGCFIRNRKIDH